MGYWTARAGAPLPSCNFERISNRAECPAPFTRVNGRCGCGAPWLRDRSVDRVSLSIHFEEGWRP